MASQVSDDSSTDEDTRREQQHLYPILKTTEEEREYGTIPGSPQATAAAIAHIRPQTNPTVPRGPPSHAERAQAKRYRRKQPASPMKLTLVPRTEPPPQRSRICVLL